MPCQDRTGRGLGTKMPCLIVLGLSIISKGGIVVVLVEVLVVLEVVMVVVVVVVVVEM